MSNETTFFFSTLDAVLAAVKVIRGIQFRYNPLESTPSSPFVASITFDLEYEDCVREIFMRKEITYRDQ